MRKDKTQHTDSFSESNIIQFLKLLSKEEMKEFTKFVYSPIYNNRSEVSKFFDTIRKFHPSFKHKDFTKEKIFASLYPGKKYKDDAIRRLSSNLFKIGEEYASFKNIRADKYNYEKNLLDFYSSKGSDKFFIKQLSKLKAHMDEDTLRDAEYFYRLSLINEVERVYKLKFDPTYKKSGFEEQIKNLWKHTMISLMRLYGFAEFETYFFNKKYDLKYLNELIRISKDSNYMNSETVEIYFLLLKLYSDNKNGTENDEIFNRLRILIDKNFSNFTKSECFNFYIHLFNYCNINKLKYNKDYSNVEFQLAEKMVESGLLVQNGVIDPGWFRGIFFKAFNAGEMKFAEKFIEDYKIFIDGKDNENVVKHAYAQLAMHKKNYDDALHHLSTASYEHINDKWTIKNMYLKIYYEINAYEEFYYTIDSIKHLIKEEGSWNQNLIQPIRNFINYAAKLFKIKLGESKFLIEELRHEILKSEVIGRKWLLEKIDELKEKN